LIELDKALREQGKAKVGALPSDIVREATRTIEPLNHLTFVKAYERACDDLGISNEYRVMTGQRFIDLKMKALDIAEKHKKIRKGKGFT
jgi:hypothetical protein